MAADGVAINRIAKDLSVSRPIVPRWREGAGIEVMWGGGPARGLLDLSVDQTDRAGRRIEEDRARCPVIMDLMDVRDVHEEGSVAWNVAEAKQRLSELLRDAAREPQEIYNRERLVGVVVGAEELAEYRSWRARRRSLAEACEEARRICADEGPLPVPARRNRRSALPGQGRTGSR